ncbi:MAG: endonuclease/exonuclease/phosphatase family protein [Patescibacteria group bacterium]
MSGVIKSVQWNIGGGMIRHPEADPLSSGSYCEDGLDNIIATLEQRDPHLITLQETHEKNGDNQTRMIAEALGYGHWVNDTYAPSHLDDSSMLGQGVISRFPIHGHSFQLFINPNFQIGEEYSHDKGLTSVTLGVGKRAVVAQTLHALPFRRLGVDIASDEARAIFDDMQAKILERAKGHSVLQGDFNIDMSSLRESFPELFEAGFSELKQHLATTPRGRRYDHLLFSEIGLLASGMLKDQLTDHYPIASMLVMK